MKKIKHNASIRTVCAVLFAIFSFSYICMFQGELLALIQDHLAKGQTSNNTFITALVITSLLMILQYLLNRVGKLHGQYEAFSYLPSCVLLALITKVDNSFSYSWVQWVVALIVVAGIYVLVAWISRNTFLPRDVKFFRLFTPNIGVLSFLFVFTGWYGNNAPADQMELAAWKYTHKGKYEKVLEVGKRSDDCNVNLTALRNLALAKTGQLGNKLFAYPQPYGSEGLMMNLYNVQTISYGANEFYNALGSHPYGGEQATAFYKRMTEKTDSAQYRDMYLSALLLERDLTTFVSYTTNKSSKDEALANAPVHYQEAWMVYNEQHPSTPVAFVPDEAISQRYQEYLALREAYTTNPTIMKNLCKRQFGDTYWYYYDFVK